MTHRLSFPLWNMLLLTVAILFSACSGSEEQVSPESPPPPPKTTEIKPVEAVREFTYTERYYVTRATIGDPSDVDDALQAIRIIQLKPGENDVLVISSFDRQGEASLETWFGIEMPSFAPGRHDLSSARNIAFYRFYLGNERKRIDGQRASGSLVIESYDGEAIIGTIDATIEGVTKSFDEASKPVKVSFSGSFRIQKAELEDTIMKSR
ncbi:MAG: hypothetical protein KFF77_11920 [Bacteroidetes bacterium]|nr:hypothetical protein [Bacteroidota bacterium]